MATAEEGIATQLRNIEARYGKTMAQWSAIVAASATQARRLRIRRRAARVTT